MKRKKNNPGATAVLNDKTGDVTVTCNTCGNPITHSDKYGMWCNKNCGRDASVRIGNRMGKLISAFDNSPVAEKALETIFKIFS